MTYTITLRNIKALVHAINTDNTMNEKEKQIELGHLRTSIDSKNLSEVGAMLRYYKISGYKSEELKSNEGKKLRSMS